MSVPGTALAVTLATQVGRPYDSPTIEKDVRYLWSLDRFDDVRVEETRAEDGIALTFRVAIRPHLRLHEIRLLPNTFGVELKVPDGTPIDTLRAHEIAREAQRQLNARGYPNAVVRESLLPVKSDTVNLQLTVDTGEARKLTSLHILGDSADLARPRALRIHRLLPGVPHLWNGWRLLPSYSNDAVDADVARIRSAYLAKGYLDAEVRPLAAEVHGNDIVQTLSVEAGPQYPVSKDLCAAMLADRRSAQRVGILDFAARYDPEHGVTVDRGPSYVVGRIEFTGNHRYSDSVVRRNFVLPEGVPFDEQLLRRSIARLNRSGLFEPVDEHSVVVQPNPSRGYADVAVHLTERKRGAWNLSGPVGPMSLAGPLQASISSRLPPWGRGLLELSTYTASVSLFAFGKPLLPILNAPKRFTPILALQRPFSPGEGWRSGFAFAPQLGWRNGALGYVTAQLQGRLMPRLTGERAAQPPLTILVTRESGDAVMACEAPKPRLALLRAAAGMALHLIGALPAL